MVKKKTKTDRTKHLEAQAFMRKRPSRFIGSADNKALTHMVQELIDNSVDEIMNGKGTCTIIQLFVKNNMLRVMDNGTGIPFEQSNSDPEGRSLLNINITTPNTGGKFDDDLDSEDKLYKYSSGLHGEGLTILAALSIYFKISSIVENKAYNIITNIGSGKEPDVLKIKHETKNYVLEPFTVLPTSDMYTNPTSPFFDKKGKRIKTYNDFLGKKSANGTLVEFIPDGNIFKHGADIFDIQKLINIIRNKHIGSSSDMYFYVYDSVKSKQASDVYMFKVNNKSLSLIDQHFNMVCKGLSDYVYSEKRTEDISNLTFDYSQPYKFDKPYQYGNESGRIKFSINWGFMLDGKKEFDSFFAMQDQIHKPVMLWANTIYLKLPEDDTVYDGIVKGLTYAIKDYAANSDINDNSKANIKKANINHIKQTLVCFLDFKTSSPQFKGQTKEAIANPEMVDIAREMVYKDFLEFLYTNSSKAKKLMALVEQFATNRSTARIKGIKVDNNLPVKLSDCMPESRKKEGLLYILEGDSASGSAKKARDNRIHALLPIRGKILNLAKVPNGKIGSSISASIADILQAIGGVNTISKGYDISKMRYRAIVIFTDADDDGAHIRSLIIILIFILCPAIIIEGRLYKAKAPLYKITLGSNNVTYTYTVEEMEEITKKLDDKGKRYGLTRFKGIGEMDPVDLSNTTLSGDPSFLIPIEYPYNISEADINNIVLDMMGSDPSYRKSLLTIFDTKKNNDDLTDEGLIELIRGSDFYC